MAEELQQHRRLAAIMFTDMVGYSALSQKDEALALELLNEHRKLLRGLFALHGGREIEAVGDGFLVECASALAAARCAVEIQRTLHDRNAAQPLDRQIHVRIGLHLGDVVAQGERVHGDGVNIAARIEPLAEPGGICVSEDVARQLRNKIDVPLLRLGKADLKNIEMPVEIYRLALPWERKHLPGSERLAFSIRQRQVRRVLMGAGGILVVGGIVGTWAWRRTGELVNNRIAVLPFVNMSANPDDEHFVDGLTEELISRLSRVKGLEVIARTSIASYKGTKKRIGEIARELNVGTVLEGSVRKAGDNVRITAQLINATNDAHLWSEDYDRELRDIFAVQRDIAQHVANALAARLALAPVATTPSGETDVRMKDAGTSDLEAYNAYLKGRFHYNKGTIEGLRKAIEYYDEASRRDPSYAIAYAALAETYVQLSAYEGGAADRLPKARVAALKALQLDDSVSDAHTALGVAKTYYDLDLPGAEQTFRRALALNANSAVTHNWYGWYLMYLRRWDEGIVELRRAIQLDPVSIIMVSDLALAFLTAGRWDEGIEQSRKALELAPDSTWPLEFLGWSYLGKGMYREARAAFEKELRGPDGVVFALAGLASTHAYAGEMTDALKRVMELKEQLKTRPSQPWVWAYTFRSLATRDDRYRPEMFLWLDKVYEERSFFLVLTTSVWWKPFESDSRWIAFRKKLGLPP